MLKKNFIYNLIYQILILIIPLVTAPYLSRVVGASGVGTYSYTYSIAHYFMLVCMLGINNYGNRTIAKSRDSKEKLSRVFWGIYIFQLAMGILMLTIYYIYIFISKNQFYTIAILQSLYIISAMVDINWFFFGIEEFKLTITRNSILKIGTVILIFAFVKESTDLWKYTLIMSGMTLLSQLVLWICLSKKIQFIKVSFKEIKKHIKPNIILFIPVIAVSIYKMMDKIMLGAIVNVAEVGYYEQAEKIINVPLTIITALGTVMLPRISNIISKGNEEQVSKYISKSISFVMFLAFPMCLGLMLVANKFIPLYLGIDFKKTSIILILLSTTLPFISFANVLRTQYLIPKEKDKIYIYSVFLGAIINIILNLILIPKFSSIGACIGTIVAEATVMIYQTFNLREDLDIREYLVNVLPFLLKAIIMFSITYFVNYIKIHDMLIIIIQIIIGIIIYTLLNLKYINSVINIKKVLKKIKRFN